MKKMFIDKHPQNPHYFIYKGSAVILVSSGDIYYDVFSPNHDFRKYLDTLAEYGMNFTRIYPAGCSAFVPSDGAGSILPWVKLDNGKFDLDRWNPAYFRRLHDFMSYAESKDVIVDVCLFNGFTAKWPEVNVVCWPLLPFNAANNIQAEGVSVEDDFTTLRSESNVKRQKEYIRKICEELDGYGNVLYDNCDEPDCLGNIPPVRAIPWVDVVLEELCRADKSGHPISQTHYPAPMFEAGGRDFCRDPRVSWISVEYEQGLRDFDSQYPIEKPYVLIETYSPGISPAWNGYWDRLCIQGDGVSSDRIHSWAFLAGGGAGYLGWSANYHPLTPGGVEPQSEVNRQKKILKDFLYGFDFVKMRRFMDFSGVENHPSDKDTVWAEAMAEPGKQYAMYINHSFRKGAYYTAVPGSYQETITLKDIPAGKYTVEWVAPRSGEIAGSNDLIHKGGDLSLRTPLYAIDIALRMKLE